MCIKNAHKAFFEASKHEKYQKAIALYCSSSCEATLCTDYDLQKGRGEGAHLNIHVSGGHTNHRQTDTFLWNTVVGWR